MYLLKKIYKIQKAKITGNPTTLMQGNISVPFPIFSLYVYPFVLFPQTSFLFFFLILPKGTLGLVLMEFWLLKNSLGNILFTYFKFSNMDPKTLTQEE